MNDKPHQCPAFPAPDQHADLRVVVSFRLRD